MRWKSVWCSTFLFRATFTRWRSARVYYCKNFIAIDDVWLVLGVNIFYGVGFQKSLSESVRKLQEQKQEVVFGYYEEATECYGLIEFDKTRKVLIIEEKPKAPK